MFAFFRNSFRFFRIAFILARYRALTPLKDFNPPRILWFLISLVPAHPSTKTQRVGQRLATALETMGPSFIKLGQTLSTRSDLVGDEVALDLSMLRDKLPPFDSAIARKIIEEQLDAALADNYMEFDDIPVAAASIAQVHKARTVEGQQVAVKILRPGIEKAFARDIEVFFWIARLLERMRPSMRRLKPVEVIETFKNMVRLEMDLRLEAAAASELKENCKDDTGFYVPNVDWKRTSAHVMTIEWVEGIPINDRKAIEAQGHDPDVIAAHLAGVFFNQAYRDGFFHADMHPGNLFVNVKGDIVPVDFGIMGRLDKQTKLYVAEILRGFLERDYHHVARIHFAAGYVPSHKSEGDFAQACRSIGEPIVGLPQNQISIARLLALLFKVTEDFEMETQPQLLLLQKTMVLVEGVGATLNPDVNMWKLAEPWIAQWAKDNISIKSHVIDSINHTKRFVEKLPHYMDSLDYIPQCFTKEGVRLHPDVIRSLKAPKKASDWKEKTLWTVVVSALTASAVLYFGG